MNDLAESAKFNPSAEESVTPPGSRPSTLPASGVIVVVILLVASFVGRRADAAPSGEPYEVYAEYVDKTAKDTSYTIHVPALTGLDATLVFLDPGSVDFRGIFFRPKTDELSKLRLQNFDSFVIEACTEPEKCERTIVGKNDVNTATPVKILPSVVLTSEREVRTATYKVYGHFTERFLCGVEDALRDRNGKHALLPAPASQAAAPAEGKGKKDKNGKMADKPPQATWSDRVVTSEKGDKSLVAYVQLFERALTTTGGDPIVYSFCSSAHDAINWTELASFRSDGNSTRKPDKEVHADEKELMVAKVLAELSKDSHVIVPAMKRKEDERDNVYELLTHEVTFVAGLKDFELHADNRKDPLSKDVVDMTSSIVLGTQDSQICNSLRCNAVFRSKVSAVLTSDASASVREVSALRPIGGSRWVAIDSLRSHLGEHVTIALVYVVDDNKTINLLVRETTVENLGWITTFPGATEIIALAQNAAKTPADIESQSTIPISWAINLSAKEASHVAVTLPWMISYNFEHSPRFAEFFKVFPHISAIFPLTSDAATKTGSSTPRLAFGVGIALASAFTFSVGVTTENPQGFLLVGISAPDLVKTWRPDRKAPAAPSSTTASK